MNVLYLTNKTAQEIDYIPSIIKKGGDDVIVWFERFDVDYLTKHAIDFIVSYRYQYLIKEPILSEFKDKMINCHPSFLPWNRGYFPNAWSIIDDTPKGSTILRIDEGIDTGDILAQMRVEIDDQDSLKDSYNKCHNAIHELFFEHWMDIRNGVLPSKKQEGEGSHYYKRDFEKLRPCLVNGWDTTIAEFRRNHAENLRSGNGGEGRRDGMICDV